MNSGAWGQGGLWFGDLKQGCWGFLGCMEMRGAPAWKETKSGNKLQEAVSTCSELGKLTSSAVGICWAWCGTGKPAKGGGIYV